MNKERQTLVNKEMHQLNYLVLPGALLRHITYGQLVAVLPTRPVILRRIGQFPFHNMSNSIWQPKLPIFTGF